jgi:hypothetical protein
MSEAFAPTDWSDEEITARLAIAGITLPPECLAGVRANLALLQDRWAVVSAALEQGQGGGA